MGEGGGDEGREERERERERGGEIEIFGHKTISVKTWRYLRCEKQVFNNIEILLVFQMK